MRDIFLEVLERSMAAGWLVLAVAALRPAMGRAPKGLRVLLWGMVALRLLCPVSIESRFSLIPDNGSVSERMLAEAEPKGNGTAISPEHTAEEPGGGNGLAADREASAGSGFSTDSRVLSDKHNIIDILSTIWISGMLLMGVYALAGYLRLQRLVATAVVMEDNIFRSERVDSPFVLGLVRPRIYIPFRTKGRNLAHVVVHEKVHILRRDHWWKPLGFVLLTVYWFHPLLWLAYILLCRDIELACDERAIRGLSGGQRADYSQALLDCSVSRRNVFACPLAFGEIGVKTRVKSILRYQKPALWIVGLAVAACIAVAVCFLTDPARDSALRDTLAWARELSPEDVAEADLVVSPRSPGREYKRLSESDIAAMVGLINRSEGEYMEEHGETEGSSTFFYLTMRDGTAHEVGNLGNTYLVIDREYYRAEEAWLASWEDVFPEGDEALPEGYLESRPQPGRPGAGQEDTQSGEPGQGEPGQTNPGRTEPGESRSGTAQTGQGQSGSGQSEPDRETGTVVWKDSDLDRDGETEIIRVREVTEGEYYLLEVLKQDGRMLWSEEAGTAHTGWNTILLCRSGEEDFLLRYHPNFSQGMGSYTCEQFTLEGGRETRENFWEITFELSSDQQITGKMRAFAEVANSFLKEGTVLLSTWEGELIVGPQRAEEVSALYPVRFGQEAADGFGEDDPWAAFDTGLPGDTPPLRFVMASGAGSWGTSLTLYPDGSFDGVYSNAEMDRAEEYPRGTCYYCEFSGKFDHITKIDEYTYSMELAELSYGTEVEKVWIQEEIRYIGAEAFGLTEGKSFRFYLPGVSMAEMDEDFLFWSPDYHLWRDGSVDRLFSYGIYNVDGGYGFFTSWRE
ncbi:MAG: M56 family metallopeptidase [Lachnospiraceae bacterium]|nr:M56 family metallopeptidase [Lachnospiraceae bacterium]